MKISYQWLQSLIHLPEDAETVGKALTSAGLEVESIHQVEAIKGGLAGLVVGEVISCEPHPQADRLKLTKVNIGTDELLNIVCGAPNVAKGQKVIVATVGATLYPTGGEPFTIKKSKIRGEASEGMLCAEDEIGIGQSHDGIMVLPEVTKVGRPVAEVLGLDSDYVFEIGLTPNRADAASHLGVARDLRAIYNRPLNPVMVQPLPSAQETANGIYPVEIHSPEACPRYTALRLANVKVGPSPEWLQKKLQAIGLNPINNVVDITNYVLHGYGQPLHAFDAAKLRGEKIEVRFAHAGEKLVLLDGKEVNLAMNDLIIADAEGPIALAGVFGGKESGITENTTEIILESAFFSPVAVRRTAQNHQLKTDASFRFERGTDIAMPPMGAALAAQLLVEIAGATITSPLNDVYPEHFSPKKIEVDFAQLYSLMGIRPDEEEVQQILKNLDYDIVAEETYGHQGFETSFTATVPSYRIETEGVADIAEDVLRIYGLDNLPLSEELSAPYLAPQNPRDNDSLQAIAAQFLAGNGWLEVMNNSLTSPVWFNLDPQEGIEPVTLLNPLSEELSVMRPNLLGNGLNTVAFNINRKQKDLKLFEFGKGYQVNNGKRKEFWQLGLWLSGSYTADSWFQTSQPTAYHHLQPVVEGILYKLTGEQPQGAIPLQADARFAFGLQWYFKGKVVAKAGLVAPKFLKQADVKQPVWYAEFDWETLMLSKPVNFQLQEVPKYPSVRRDLSLLLDEKVSYRELETLAFKVEKKLLKEVNAFSVYKGENLGEGKKSYALSYILQHPERTLTDPEIDQIMQAISTKYASELGAELRK